MADNQSFRFIKRKETPISPFNDRALIASTSEGIGAGMSDRDKAKIEHEKSETIKDIAQFTLDLTGILDPTPVSDGTNALISLGRGNWVDAFISVVSIVPFIGDVAKLGKFSRYLDSIRKAIKIAEKDGVWAIALTKLLKPLRKFIDQLIKVFGDPPKKLLQIKDEIDRFMPSTMDGAAPGGRIVNPRANPANQARKSRIDKAADGGRIESGGVKNVPFGFRGTDEFQNFSKSINTGLNKAGLDDAQALFQGSAVTGKKFTTGEAFDVGRKSDFDLAISSSQLIQKAKEAGISLRSQGTRTGPLKAVELEKLGLSDLSKQLSLEAGRPVNFMIFDGVKAAANKAPSILVPK